MFKKLQEKFRYDRENMNYIRFKFNYVCFPIIFAIIILDLFAVLCLLANNEKIKATAIIMCFAIFVSCIIALLIISAVVKKKELLLEADKLRVFFKAELLKNPDCEYVLPREDTDEGVYLTFSENGIKLSDLEYSYNGFECGLYTSNYLRQISLILVFSRTDIGDQEDGSNLGVKHFSLPLNLNLLSIMHKFKIKIKNADVLRFIKDNPELAAKQILNYGKVQDNYSDFEK